MNPLLSVRTLPSPSINFSRSPTCGARLRSEPFSAALQTRLFPPEYSRDEAMLHTDNTDVFLSATGHGRQRSVTSGSALSSEEAPRADGYDVSWDAVGLIQSYAQVCPYSSSMCSAFPDVLTVDPLKLSPSLSLCPLHFPHPLLSSFPVTTLLNAQDKTYGRKNLKCGVSCCPALTFLTCCRLERFSTP
jgi:hypothetical protein